MLAHGCCLLVAVSPSVLRHHGSPGTVSLSLSQDSVLSSNQHLGLKDVHSPHHVLPADGALAHPLATFGASDHVAALQQHTVDDGVHADPAQVLIGRQLSPDPVCGDKVGEGSVHSFLSCISINLPVVVLNVYANYIYFNIDTCTYKHCLCTFNASIFLLLLVCT